MGSYSGSSDWDDLPSSADQSRFKPNKATVGGSGEDAGTEEPLAIERRGAGKPIDLVLAFDVTASMNPYIGNVREKIDYLVQGLLKLMDIRIALVGVSDHTALGPLLQITPYSDRLEDLQRSIQEFRAGFSNSDIPEAYECLFKHLNDDASWWSGRPLVLIFVGDSVPHGMGYGAKGQPDLGCPLGVDARQEIDRLRPRLKSFWFVGCGKDEQAKAIQRSIVASENQHIELDNFRRLTNLVMAVCMEEVGELDYFLDLLESQRGKDRRAEVLALMKR